jgi:hypothetical protein
VRAVWAERCVRYAGTKHMCTGRDGTVCADGTGTVHLPMRRQC